MPSFADLMTSFSGYWKEFAVVIASVSAIAGALFEVRDKRTHRITAWGRTFFLVTILSLIGGFYAQWQDNAKDASSAAEDRMRILEAQKRTAKIQDDMLHLVTKMDGAIAGIGRSLQPIGETKIGVRLTVECDICKEIYARQVSANEGVPCGQIRTAHTLVPKYAYMLAIEFFRDASDAKYAFSAGELTPGGDVVWILTLEGALNHASGCRFWPIYGNGERSILFEGYWIQTPSWANGKILSYVDLKAGKMLVFNPYTKLLGLSDFEISITTSVGQSLNGYQWEVANDNLVGKIMMSKYLMGRL